MPYATDTLGMRTPLDTQTLAALPVADQRHQHAHRAGVGDLPRRPCSGALRPLERPAGRRPAGLAGGHLVFLAPTGSGKTVTAGTLKMRWATTEDPPDIVLIDPVKGDYRSMVEALGGQIVRCPPTPRW